jgi:energy-coupling factor transporter ATP-binding protein EcfA2
VSLERIELVDFRIFDAAAFTPEAEGTTVITGPNGTGKTSVLEALVYLGTQRSFRGAPREAMVRTGADRAIIRAQLQAEAIPTLVEAEIVLAGRSRTQVNRKVARGRIWRWPHRAPFSPPRTWLWSVEDRVFVGRCSTTPSASSMPKGPGRPIM